jgi:sugar O-acyltransferase (sialic acid O-acetyltransferase NeuD family)
MSRRLVILGAGGHGRAVGDLAEACGWSVVGFTDRSAADERVLGRDDDLPALRRSALIDAGIVGVGNTALQRRAELFDRLRESGLVIATLIHPRATVSSSARVGQGSVVFPSTVLGAGVTVGDNVVIYSAAVAEHECRIGDHVYLSPGAILSGAVVVEVGYVHRRRRGDSAGPDDRQARRRRGRRGGRRRRAGWRDGGGCSGADARARDVSRVLLVTQSTRSIGEFRRPWVRALYRRYVARFRRELRAVVWALAREAEVTVLTSRELADPEGLPGNVALRYFDDESFHVGPRPSRT